jgi:hypothetical protein
MWVDEQMLALNARDRSFAELAGPLWLNQSAPPGWLALERAALLTIGTSERAARLLTLLFGVGTLIVGVWIGRRWMGPLGAAVLVLLCGIGPWMVFFTLELKHYSADTLWALLLPALGAWAVEAPESQNRMRRTVVWWLAAAVGPWFSNGALFVAPLCAAVLVATNWRAGGPAAAVKTAFLGIIWLTSFGLLYALALRHTLANPYLQNYWGFAFPPQSAGAGEIGGWLARQFEPFAVKPVGTSYWIRFWVAVAAGLVFATATRGPVGLLFATAPFSLALLAVLRLVPPFERLALWVVPLLYTAVAFCADASVWFLQRSYSRRRIVPFALALATGAAALTVSADIYTRGRVEFEARGASNYGLDDRRSVRLLLRLLRPGDALMTTHFGLAGIWWYSGLSIAGPDPAGGQLHDGTPMFEIGHTEEESECPRWEQEMETALSGRSRAVVYLAFRLNVLPGGFDSLVLQYLGKRGELVGYQEYAEESILAAFDLKAPPLEPLDLTRAPFGRFFLPPAQGEVLRPRVPGPGGCITIAPARRW